MDALKDVDVVDHLYQLSGTGTIHTVDDLKAKAQALMPDVGAEQLTHALRGLATKLWDTNHGGFRNEYRRSRGRNRAQPQSLSVHH